ncbi:unnamed protein product [Trichogramma brassicae]|uniref:Uncharacterized protein n=1 Tax=Trichogramma brassicae TaxID=86971 RepID=A0A6H5INL6_9HYME|nr:unnamed protein product [Trichogramma brassicae]
MYKTWRIFSIIHKVGYISLRPHMRMRTCAPAAVKIIHARRARVALQTRTGVKRTCTSTWATDEILHKGCTKYESEIWHKKAGHEDTLLYVKPRKYVRMFGSLEGGRKCIRISRRGVNVCNLYFQNRQHCQITEELAARRTTSAWHCTPRIHPPDIALLLFVTGLTVILAEGASVISNMIHSYARVARRLRAPAAHWIIYIKLYAANSTPAFIYMVHLVRSIIYRTSLKSRSVHFLIDPSRLLFFCHSASPRFIIYAWE